MQVVRQHIVPDYPLEYACKCNLSPRLLSQPKRRAISLLTSFYVALDQVGWRCLVPAERLRHIPDLRLTNTSWWYGKAKSLWLSPLDADVSNLTDIEFTARVFNEPPVPGETVSWGRRVSNEKVFSRFSVSMAP